MSDTSSTAGTAQGSDGGQQQGAPAAAPTTTPAAPAAPTPAAQAPAAFGGQQQQAPAAQQQGSEGEAAPQVDMTGWPEEARQFAQRQINENARLRRERGDERINAKNAARQEGATEQQKALAKALAPLLGIEVPDDAAPTPEQLAEQVGTVTSERDAAKLDSAVNLAAWQAGIDPGKLGYLKYALTQADALKGIDPSAPDAGAKIKALVDAQASTDPSLKMAGATAATGAEKVGGADSGATITPEKFAAMSLAERQQLYVTDKDLYNRLAGVAV